MSATDTIVNDLAPELYQQVREELGPNFTRAEQDMLQQKYGILPPKLTRSDKTLIARMREP